MSTSANTAPAAPPQNTKSKHQRFGLQSLDLMGSKFDLAFPTSTGRFQTMMGGYVTLAMSFITISAFFLIFAQLFNTDSPVVTSSTELNPGVSEFNILEESLATPIGLSSGLNLITDANEVKRYMTLQVMVSRVDYSRELQSFVPQTPKLFNYIPCTEVKNHPQLNTLVDKIAEIEAYKNTLLCPDVAASANQLTTLTGTEDNSFQTVRLLVYPCSLADSTQCATAQELKKASINYIKVSKLLISSNFENPVELTTRQVPVRIDKSVVKTVKFGIYNNRILDDSTQIRPETVRAEYATYEIESSDHQQRNPTQVHCTAQMIAAGPAGGCMAYVNLDYTAKSETFMTRRAYKKGTTVMAEFGGVLKLMTTVVFFIYSWYNNSKIRKFVIDNVFYVHKEKGDSMDRRVENFFNPPKPMKGANKVAPAGVKKEEKRIDEVLKETIQSRSCIVDLIQKLNFAEILEDALLDEKTKNLIPEAILCMKERELAEKAQKSENGSSDGSVSGDQKSESQGQSRGSIASRPSRVGMFAKKNSLTVNSSTRPGSSLQSQLQKAMTPDPNKSVYQQAWESLLLHQQLNAGENEVQRLLDEYFVEHLKPIFEDSADIAGLGGAMKIAFRDDIDKVLDSDLEDPGKSGGYDMRSESKFSKIKVKRVDSELNTPISIYQGEKPRKMKFARRGSLSSSKMIEKGKKRGSSRNLGRGGKSSFGKKKVVVESSEKSRFAEESSFRKLGRGSAFHDSKK